VRLSLEPEPTILQSLLRFAKSHPLSVVVALTTAWIVWRRLSFDPRIHDAYGPGFLGDFLAHNIQVAGYMVTDSLSLDSGSWWTVCVAAAVTLALALALEWSLQRLMRRAK
jgi:hypothetical protein